MFWQGDVLSTIQKKAIQKISNRKDTWQKICYQKETGQKIGSNQKETGQK